jgi:hypothetical protein
MGGRAEMAEIRFAGQLTERDFTRLSNLVSQKLWLGLAALLGLFTVFLFWQWGWLRIVAYPTQALTTFAPLILVLPLILLLRPLVLRRYWRNNKISQYPVSGSLSDEALTWNVEGLSSGRYPWNLMLAYRDSPSLLLVYQGPNQVFYFLPHFFADDAQWHACRTLVKSRLRRK